MWSFELKLVYTKFLVPCLLLSKLCFLDFCPGFWDDEINYLNSSWGQQEAVRVQNQNFE